MLAPSCKLQMFWLTVMLYNSGNIILLHVDDDATLCVYESKIFTFFFSLNFYLFA
jgi:hypothetical protein